MQIYLVTLNAKFKVALAEFSKLGITGVIQGDLMYHRLINRND